MIPTCVGKSIFLSFAHASSDVQGSALSRGLGWAELSRALGDGLVTAWARLEHFKSPGRALRLRLSSQILGKELGLLIPLALWAALVP